MKHADKIAALRAKLADKDLGMLRELEEHGSKLPASPEVELVLEAVNVELAARIAAEFGGTVTLEEFKVTAAAARRA